MNNIEIDKSAALEQIYESMKKDDKYLEVKLLVPKIEGDLEDIKPLGNVTVKNIGAMEIAYMICSLEQVIVTLRAQHSKVEEIEKMFKKKFKLTNKTIYTDQEEN